MQDHDIHSFVTLNDLLLAQAAGQTSVNRLWPAVRAVIAAAECDDELDAIVTTCDGFGITMSPETKKPEKLTARFLSVAFAEADGVLSTKGITAQNREFQSVLLCLRFAVRAEQQGAVRLDYLQQRLGELSAFGSAAGAEAFVTLAAALCQRRADVWDRSALVSSNSAHLARLAKGSSAGQAVWPRTVEAAQLLSSLEFSQRSARGGGLSLGSSRVPVTRELHAEQTLLATSLASSPDCVRLVMAYWAGGMKSSQDLVARRVFLRESRRESAVRADRRAVIEAQTASLVQQLLQNLADARKTVEVPLPSSPLEADDASAAAAAMAAAADAKIATFDEVDEATHFLDKLDFKQAAAHASMEGQLRARVLQQATLSCLLLSGPAFPSAALTLPTAVEAVSQLAESLAQAAQTRADQQKSSLRIGPKGVVAAGQLGGVAIDAWLLGTCRELADRWLRESDAQLRSAVSHFRSLSQVRCHLAQGAVLLSLQPFDIAGAPVHLTAVCCHV